MSVFASDPDFCGNCGSILPVESGLSILQCQNCGHKVDLSTMQHVARKSRIYLNTGASRSTSQAVTKYDGPIAERKCGKCEHFGMAYLTLQLRSADEGQTVIYTCPRCGCKDIENS
ncbi:DNA-directed RNA polymerase I subunit RPA12-like isoform X2 [Paramacrobiotus metropolitanus]|uniref:DNA-directed RNA polymerase I subunit RPA12-like isoform X2 n=1 Tax=Paramacrobiotus metropolitanus TaxID=2943436 RepID=UPI00244656A6|nr:DNA-directed RNA polymerase I subunit RPA12-like isoform X2 [Paramacrobiotus metropolitanus]